MKILYRTPAIEQVIRDAINTARDQGKLISAVVLEKHEWVDLINELNGKGERFSWGRNWDVRIDGVEVRCEQ